MTNSIVEPLIWLVLEECNIRNLIVYPSYDFSLLSFIALLIYYLHMYAYVCIYVCLTQVLLRRPPNPIGFISEWLIRYNEDRRQDSPAAAQKQHQLDI